MKVREVIVIGGGIIGATAAAALCEKGMDVTLLETATCASRGGSAFSGGIVRLYDRDPKLRAIGLHANDVIRASDVGRLFDAGIRRTGVLYRTHESECDDIERALAGHKAFHRAEFLTTDARHALTDFLPDRPEMVDLLERDGGYSDVRFTTHIMAHYVRDNGTVLEHAPVKEVRTVNQNLAEVHLEDETVLKAHCVVIATGPWASTLTSGANVEARTVPLGLLEVENAPAFPVIDMSVGTYAVPVGKDVLGIGCGPRSTATIPSLLPKPSQHQVDDSIVKFAALCGASRETRSLGVLAGVDSYTQDGRPLVGFRSKNDPVFLMSGMNGVGFKMAPALADIAASQIHARLRDTNHDQTELCRHLAPSRFNAALESA